MPSHQHYLHVNEIEIKHILVFLPLKQQLVLTQRDYQAHYQ
uniref:Nuclear pore complex protein NUP1 isoform X1 n=1 Tax=Rhizophora mucronata TaxID=61149 RepID=A0A2P2LGE9_RHIMU